MNQFRFMKERGRSLARRQIPFLSPCVISMKCDAFSVAVLAAFTEVCCECALAQDLLFLSEEAVTRIQQGGRYEQQDGGTNGEHRAHAGGLFLAGCGSGGDSPVQAQNSGVIDLSGVTPN